VRSNRIKFKGREEQIKKDVRQLGYGSAQTLYPEAKDYIAWEDYVKTLLGEDEFSKTPFSTKIALSSSGELATEIVSKILQKISDVEADNERLRTEIKELKDSETIREQQKRLLAVRVYNKFGGKK